MEIQTNVKTAPALLDQFYEKRRLLILSAPDISDPDYQLQNIMIQVRPHLISLKMFNKQDKHHVSIFPLQKADCGLGLRHVTVIELLGSPPRETGRIKESLLEPQVTEGLR